MESCFRCVCSLKKQKQKQNQPLFSFQYHNASFDWAYLSKKECLKYGGKLVGNNCDFVPDITLMSFILFLGTYTSSMAMKKFKTSRYFPTTVSPWDLNNFHWIWPVSPLMHFYIVKKVPAVHLVQYYFVHLNNAFWSLFA